MTTAKASTPGLGDGVGAFFLRHGFAPCVKDQCRDLTENLFPGVKIEDARPQGYCSYTLCVGHDRIIQFRPAAHKLPVSVAEAACEVYGELAPKTHLLTVFRPTSRSLSKSNNGHAGTLKLVDEGIVIEDEQDYLDVVCMARIRGTSLSEFRAVSADSMAFLEVMEQRHSIIRHFAQVIATGMRHSRHEFDTEVSALRSHIGGSLGWRLEQMHSRLPERFQRITGETLARLDEIKLLPWVLTHGDMVPANIMVEPSRVTQRILILTGLLDWAEAEYLPFGVGLYGLEELLGGIDASGRFSYYPDENELRALFWAHLEINLQGDGPSRELVDAAHKLGVLLWHGIAFDDGKLSRVVQEGLDDEEIFRLDAFFKVAGRNPMT